MDKCLERLRRHQKDASFKLVDSTLRGCGFRLERQRGSHKLYRHPTTGEKFVYPSHRVVGEHYVRELIRLLERMQISQEETKEE